MSKRNMAAILSSHIDSVSDRLIDITSPLSSEGTIGVTSVTEYKQWYKILMGLRIMLIQYGGQKRTPRFLTAGGKYRLLSRMVVSFGNNVQHMRVNDGVSTDRLEQHDAAYAYLSNQLKQMKVKREAQASREVQQMRVGGPRVVR